MEKSNRPISPVPDAENDDIALECPVPGDVAVDEDVELVSSVRIRHVALLVVAWVHTEHALNDKKWH